MPINSWLRWYHGTVSDPKWRVIAEEVGQPVAIVVAVWACLMENASQSEDRGTLQNWSDKVASVTLGIDVETVKRICNTMKQSETKVLVSDRLASWEKRNPKREREDNSTERVQRFRERNAKETPRNATKRPEKRRVDNTYTPDFLLFWEAYPKAVGKGDAFKAWRKIERPPMVALMIAAINQQKQTAQWLKDGGQFIPNPATWINQRRWEDRPIENNGHKMPSKPVPVC